MRKPFIIGILLITTLLAASACIGDVDEQSTDDPLSVDEQSTDDSLSVDEQSTDDSPSADEQSTDPAVPPMQLLAACPAQFHPTTTGGEAAWTVECLGRKVYVNGWVKDTKADGRCARINAFIGSRHRSAKACPKGTVTRFNWSGNGNSARVFLEVS